MGRAILMVLGCLCACRGINPDFDGPAPGTGGSGAESGSDSDGGGGTGASSSDDDGTGATDSGGVGTGTGGTGTSGIGTGTTGTTGGGTGTGGTGTSGIGTGTTGTTGGGTGTGGTGTDGTTGSGTTGGTGGCDNLLANPSVETGDLQGWDVYENGGDGWAIIESNNAPHGTRVLTTSYEPFTRGQEIDLLAAGFSAAVLDAAPTISVEVFFKEIYQSDPWWVTVTLLDGNRQVIDSWDDTGVTPGQAGDYGDDVWFRVANDLAGYGAGVRYIHYEDGGQDGEYWAGNFGIAIDAASVKICP